MWGRFAGSAAAGQRKECSACRERLEGPGEPAWHQRPEDLALLGRGGLWVLWLFLTSFLCISHIEISSPFPQIRN